MEDIKYQLFSAPILRVLDVLLHHAMTQAMTDSDVLKEVRGVKRAAVHQALVKLHRLGVMERTTKGRRCYNILKTEHVWLAPLKIASNLLELTPLINALKKNASRIVLFGSRARGTNRADSDYDLLVVTNNAEIVRKIIAESSLTDFVQLVVKSPGEMLDLATHEPTFVQEIQEGVTLWQR